MSSEIREDVQLPWTGERYVPGIKGAIEMEHLHRYAIACDLAYGKDVLDIACGEGYGSELLATVARRVTGVDISEEAIVHASGKYGRSNISFIVGSCARIPLPDASVDLVVSFETIEHHDQHLEMMQEIKRVLRPDGVLIISSPDKLEYSDLPGYTNEYHVKELYLREFRDLLSTGFKHVRIFGQRVYFGSFVAPTNGRATCFASYSRRGESVRREPGVMKPIYHIALASNSTLPEIHGGLYDGTSYLSSQIADSEARIAKLRQMATEREGRIAGLNKAVAELQAIRLSTSWRLTAPLRFIKRSSLHVRRRLRKAAAIIARSLYRVLPLSFGRKVKLKGWLFSAFPFLFRHSVAYRNWLVSAGQQPAPGHISDRNGRRLG